MGTLGYQKRAVLRTQLCLKSTWTSRQWSFTLARVEYNLREQSTDMRSLGKCGTCRG